VLRNMKLVKLFGLLLLFLLGCSLKERAAPVVATFLDGVPVESTVEGIPFEHAWLGPTRKEREYHSVYIKPVRADMLSPDEWKRSRGLAVTSKEEFDKIAAVLARYFRIRLLGELNKVANPRFEVVEAPREDSLVVELALTELVLSEPVVRGLGLAAPVPGVDVALSTISDPHVAFAARATDSSGTKLLATVADRRFPPVRVIDLNKLRATSSAREIVSQWSRELAETIQTDELTPVERSSWYSLWVW
jgi:hypothetical protein